MIKRTRVFACMVLVAACRGDGTTVAPGNTAVFADRGSRQCESTGVSPEESAQVLIDAGVDVLRSDCGIRTGVAFPAVCGGPTGEIIVHQIRSVNLPTAERLGFAPVSTLVNPVAGTGYELADC